jgi:hypothetical protein
LILAALVFLRFQNEKFSRLLYETLTLGGAPRTIVFDSGKRRSLGSPKAIGAPAKLGGASARALRKPTTGAFKQLSMRFGKDVCSSATAGSSIGAIDAFLPRRAMPNSKV